MRCAEVEPLIVPYLDGKLDLPRKMEIVRHIKGFDEHNHSHFPGRREASHPGGCEQCRSELEFYFLVYISIGRIEDQALAGDYGKEVEKMLRQTEREWERKVWKVKVRRFQLIAILMILGLALSFGVGKSIIEPESEPISAVRPSFALKGPALPESIDFVNRAIQAYKEGAFDFTASQQARGIARQRVGERDCKVIWAMREGGKLQYALPDELVESAGSFVERVSAGKKPAYKPSIRFTLEGY